MAAKATFPVKQLSIELWAQVFTLCKALGHGLYQNGACAQLCLTDALLLRKGRTLDFNGIRPGLVSTLHGPYSDKAHGLRFLYT